MIRMLLSILLISFFTVNLYSRDISLENAIQLGIENSDDLNAALKQIEKVQEVLNEVSANRLPTVSLNGQYRVGSDLFFEKSMTSSNYLGNLGVEANYLLFAFGAISDSINAVKFTKEATAVQREIIKTELAYSIKVAYFSALVSDLFLQIAKESYANAVKSKKLIETQAAVRAPQADLIKISSDIASRKIGVATSNIDRSNAYRLLKTLIYVDPNEEINLSTLFNQMNKPTLTERMIIANLSNSDGFELINQLKIYDIQIESDMYNAKSVGKGTLPKLSIAGGYGLSNYGNFSDTPSLGLPSGNITSDEGYIGLFLSYQFFDGFKSKSQKKQFIVDSQIKSFQKNSERRNITNELLDALLVYNQYQSILKLNNEAIVLGQRSYELSLARFLNGQTSATELNDVERTLSLLKRDRALTMNNIFSSLAVIGRYLPEVSQ